jgi:hypothetical protein
MKTTIVSVVSLVLVVSTAAFLVAAELHPAPAGGLTVHEWGTFTSVAGADGAAVDWDALGGKNDLPAFVNDFGYRCFKWRLTGTVRMETPVIYFYSPEALDAHVKVAFPQGLITEWYPRAEYGIYQKSGRDGAVRRLEPNLSGIDTSLRTLSGDIEWANIRIQPDAAPVLPTENRPSRYYAARAVDAAPLTAGGQQEKFLFYRGVGRFAVPISARLGADGRVAVENRNPDPIPAVILFENHAGRLGFRNVGALQHILMVDAPQLDGNFSRLRTELETALIAQGLFPKEAQAMVETWKDSWFEEGSRLIYIVPSNLVDTILPLRVEPAPAAVARVFVGRIELITPETKRAVTEAIDKGDASTMATYGRFLDPLLTRIAAENPSLSARIEQIRSQTRSSSFAEACSPSRR